MSSEDYEIFKILKKESQQEGQTNREQGKLDFKEASTLAAKNGLRFAKCDRDGIRYRLEKPGIWIKDIFPGNKRIYCPNPRKKGPFLGLSFEEPWTLLDVVRAAIEAEKGIPDDNHSRSN